MSFRKSVFKTQGELPIPMYCSYKAPRVVLMGGDRASPSLRILCLWESWPYSAGSDTSQETMEKPPSQNGAILRARKNGNEVHKNGIVLCVSFSPVGKYSGKMWHNSDSSVGAIQEWKAQGKTISEDECIKCTWQEAWWTQGFLTVIKPKYPLLFTQASQIS